MSAFRTVVRQTRFEISALRRGLFMLFCVCRKVSVYLSQEDLKQMLRG